MKALLKKNPPEDLNGDELVSWRLGQLERAVDRLSGRVFWILLVAVAILGDRVLAYLGKIP